MADDGNNFNSSASASATSISVGGMGGRESKLSKGHINNEELVSEDAKIVIQGIENGGRWVRASSK